MNGEAFDPAGWEDFSRHSGNSTPAPGFLSSDQKLSPGTVMQMHGLPAFAEGTHIPDPIISDELLKRAKFRFPVHACGYNWLESNDAAADRLKSRIYKIIAENNRGRFKCTQVILVTHSMGGLVARACAQLPDMESMIAGIVHGVMPTVGTPVAYRRCKIGMWDEDKISSLVIGTDGPSVTAVFAQSPGALQLLPSREYGVNWLQIHDEKGRALERLPVDDPYTEVYLRKDRWWGLVRESWLSPVGGIPLAWKKFAKNIEFARDFHSRVSGKYHPNTFVFYGAGDGKQASFETIT
jgi:pimeloyl-ACP methyl ester carboxylesterase